MTDRDYVRVIAWETPDALIPTSLDGTILNWSRGAEGAIGYAGEETAGRGTAGLLHEREWR
jgi:PAS domain S-box-containing protein